MMRWAAVGALAIGLLMGAILLSSLVVPSTGTMCDGAPEWMVPDDYAGGGCVAVRPFYEALLPGNWGEWRNVCLGMCASVEDVYHR